MIYQVAMTNFLVLGLRSEHKETLFFNVFYYPIVGFTFVFIINQFSSEYVQWKNSESNMDYFSDYWNMNDLTYLLLNMTVLISNCTGVGVELET